MRRAPSADPHHGEQVGLPTVVEQLLVDVVADGFTLYRCGPKTAPNALVASYEWDHHVDLLTIRDLDRVSAARVPKRDTVDIFAPQVVVWAHEGPPQQALRALLELVHPAHPAAPTTEYPAPASLHVPRAQQRPMTIRPPLTTPSPSAGPAAHHRDDGPRRVIAGVSAAEPITTQDPRLATGRASGPRRSAPAVSRPPATSHSRR